MKYLSILILFLLSVIHVNSYAQQDSIPVRDLVEKNNAFVNQVPLEKVYLHFDKPYYAVGDTIWFKAYLTSLQNVPSPLSKILYIDVLTEKDSIVNSIKLPIIGSVGHGSIPISHFSYKQGNYHIRAYTKWMMNFGSAYFFNKNIPIGNSINKDLSTHITFQNKASDKNVQVNATVQYKGEDGKPLAGRKVSWEVEVDFERIGRGRGETDANGNLSIGFSAGKNVDIRSGLLMTSIELTKDKVIKANFPLSYINTVNDLQFFPEGGEFVAGLTNTLGFKAVQQNGLGVEASGTVVDGSGAEVATFSSLHKGMGKFSFVPESGKTYFANVRFSDGTSGAFKLPALKEEGISLTVDNSDASQIRFMVQSNRPFLSKNHNRGFYIIGRSGGIVYYGAQSVLRSQEYSAAVPRANFPTGLVQFSILAADGRVLSERLVFNQQADSLKLTLESDLPSYKQRQKVKMKLSLAHDSVAIPGNFSVAVIDESKVPVNENQETTIMSSILLSSELQGFIEEPNYYFIGPDARRKEALDVLMLTQGYRRYLYTEVLNDKTPAVSFLPEQGLSVSGVIRRKDGMPLEKGRLLLQIPEKSFYKDGTTDEKGRFSFDNLVFQDSVEVIVNARNNLNSENLMINIDGDPFPAPEKSVNTPANLLNIDSALATYLQHNQLQNSSGFLLREVAVEGRAARRPSHRDHSALSGLAMQADHTVPGDQLKGCNNLLNCLSSSLGLTYVDNVLYLTRAYNSGNRLPVEIYANGMPVDVYYLQGLQPEGIESIQIFNDDGMTGINSRSNTMGVVVINMKEVKKVQISKAELKELFPPSNIMKFRPAGYEEERQFYVPVYEGPRTSLQSKDIRSTIHWNPYIITEEEGVATFEFFTADDKGTYRVVVEGLDDHGYLGRAVYRFQVQ